MAKIYFIVPVMLLLAFFVQEGEPLRCWVCSSDLNPQCNDPFQASHDDNSFTMNLQDCEATSGITYPYLTSSKSACKKQKITINGFKIITRGCTWKRKDDYSTNCPLISSDVNVETTFCETCEYDGCNA